MPEFESIEGGREEVSESVEYSRLNRLIMQYECNMSDKPRWCICGRGPGYRIEGIVSRIKPCDEDEMIARQMAELMNKLGGDVSPQMTEFNPSLEGEPFYYTYRRALDEFGKDLASMGKEKNSPNKPHLKLVE